MKEKIILLVLSVVMIISLSGNVFAEEVLDSELGNDYIYDENIGDEILEAEPYIEDSAESDFIDASEDITTDENIYEPILEQDIIEDGLIEEAEELYVEPFDETELETAPETEFESETMGSEETVNAVEENTEEYTLNPGDTGELEFDIEGTKILDARATTHKYTKINNDFLKEVYSEMKYIQANPGCGAKKINFTKEKSPEVKYFSAEWVNEAKKKNKTKEDFEKYLHAELNNNNFGINTYNNMIAITTYVTSEDPEYYWTRGADYEATEDYEILGNGSMVVWINKIRLIPFEIFPGAIGRQNGIEGKIQTSYNEVIKNAIDLDGNPTLSDVEFLMSAHDYIIKNTYYDFDRLEVLENKINKNEIYDEIKEYSITTIDPVFYHDNGGVICEGYAKAFKVLCDRRGIECEIILNDEHSWNAVKVNNIWYYVDVTQDDQGSYGNTICREWFLAGSNHPNLNETHHIEKSFYDQINIKLPKISISDYNIYSLSLCEIENAYDKEGSMLFDISMELHWEGSIYDWSNNRYLIENEDFKIAGNNSFSSPGTFNVKIIGIGKYKGEMQGRVVISKRPEENKSGHKFTEWETVRKATSKKNGLKERICEYCGRKETKTIKYKKTKASSTKKQTNKTTKKKHKHKWGKWKITKKATKKKTGIKERKCKTCKKKQKAKVPKLSSNKKKTNTKVAKTGFGFSTTK